MTEIPRRTVAELIARYELEPELRDVFVEGWFDCRVIRWFAKELSLFSVAVYEIDTVEIEAGELIDLGLPDNNRSRVIFLAIRLSAVIGQSSHTITCVADKDFDCFCGSQFNCGVLLYSDLSSMEMYFYRCTRFRETLVVDLGLDDDLDELFARLDAALRSLFVYRCANLSLGWGMQWMDPWKCMDTSQRRLSFDESEFVTRYLNKNGRLGQIGDFEVAIVEIRSVADSSPELAIRGHDAFEVLAWVLQKLGKKRELCDELVLRSLARASSRIDDLLNYSLFQTLKVRLTK